MREGKGRGREGVREGLERGGGDGGRERKRGREGRREECQIYRERRGEGERGSREERLNSLGLVSVHPHMLPP